MWCITITSWFQPSIPKLLWDHAPMVWIAPSHHGSVSLYCSKGTLRSDHFRHLVGLKKYWLSVKGFLTFISTYHIYIYIYRMKRSPFFAMQDSLVGLNKETIPARPLLFKAALHQDNQLNWFWNQIYIVSKIEAVGRLFHLLPRPLVLRICGCSTRLAWM